MRLDHLLSREIFVYLKRKWNRETLSPQGFLGFWGAVGYRNNQIRWVCLFGSLTLGFWVLGFFGLVVCFLESGCECLCDALKVRILFVDRAFLVWLVFFLFIGLFFVFERLVDALASCADEGRCGWR